MKPTVYIETSVISYLTAQVSRDYLVTWNCTHIAGGKVKLLVERTNAGSGMGSPVICTPEELMEI